MDIIEQEFTLSLPEGQELGCLKIENSFSDESSEIIVLGSATAVKYTFYIKFAKYLAEHGFIVILFDYLGIGKSLHGPIRKVKTDMAEWGSRDLQAVIDWTLTNYNREKIHYVGHSVGGQVLGLLRNPNVFDKVLLVSSQIGYWRYYNRRKYWYAFLYYIIWRPLATIFGYMPMKLLGMGENLPKDQSLQWCSWLKKKNYLFDDEKIDTSRYGQVKAKILSYSFTDDNWAPLKAVQAMVDHYTNSTIEYRDYNPKDHGLKSISHFGFFKEKNKDLFWKQAVDFFKEK